MQFRMMNFQIDRPFTVHHSPDVWPVGRANIVIIRCELIYEHDENAHIPFLMLFMTNTKFKLLLMIFLFSCRFEMGQNGSK